MDSSLIDALADIAAEHIEAHFDESCLISDTIQNVLIDNSLATADLDQYELMSEIAGRIKVIATPEA